jgi:hypothetical protein
VCYRSSGWYLWLRVHPTDQTTYEPVTSADQVEENDIVFCQVASCEAQVVDRRAVVFQFRTGRGGRTVGAAWSTFTVDWYCIK